MGHQGTPSLLSRRIGKALGLSVVTVAVVLTANQFGQPIDAARAQEHQSKDKISTSVTTSTAITRSTVVALARLLPMAGLISVGARPGLRIDEIKVKEGDQVSEGAVLAILEGHAEARNQLVLARARRTLQDREHQARLTAARKAAEASKARFTEGNTLYKQFSGTLKGKERYDAEMALAQVELQSHKADLDLKLLEAAGAVEGRADGQRGPRDEILDAQIALAEAAVKDTEVRAPTSGNVLRIPVHSGELSTGTLLEMGNISSMSALAEVYQSDVPRIHLNDPADVEILGKRVSGKVSRIGSMVGANRLTSVDPRALRDLRVVEVTIQLDNPAEASRYVNMEVEVSIRPSSAQGITP